MPGARVKLTKKVVDGIAPSGRDQYLWDSEVVGFGLKVTPAGGRSYVLQYRFGGRSRRYSIGRHGSPWTIETARDRARILLGDVASGLDPQEEKVGVRRELTVAELCDLYVKEGLVTRKPTSIAGARGDVENHIKPLLGRKKASLLCRQDVERFLIRVAEGGTARRYRSPTARGPVRVRGGKGAATSAVGVLSAALSFGVRRGLCADNPALWVRKFPSRKVERFLSAAELARLGEVLSAATALGAPNPFHVAALKLLMLTGCRRNEILSLKRAHVDRVHSCLRLPDSKTGQKVVHVGAPALAVMDAIPEIIGNPYLLPGRGGRGHVTDLQATWEQIRAAAGLEDVRLHDLRHSFASIGAASGDSLMVIGALLGHRSAKTTERYAHLADHPVKGAAQRIAAEIARMLSPEEPAAPMASFQPPAQEEVAAPSALKSLVGEVTARTWLDTRAAAARTGLKASSLATYRWMGVGPPFRKVRRRIVYDQAELDVWAHAMKSGWSPRELAEEARGAGNPSSG